MKREPQILFLIFFVVIISGGCERHHQALISDNEFQKQISGALHLKELYSNNDYRSPFLKVFNDTIVGIIDKGYNDSSYLFTQCIKNGHIDTIRLSKDQQNIYGKPKTQIEELKDNYLYLPRFARGTVLKIGPNGYLKEIFKSYDHEILYAKRVLFHDNHVIINGFRGIYIFDLPTQKLLWNYRFPYRELNNDLINIFDHNLVFTCTQPFSNGELNTYIICIDLNSFQIAWKRTLDNDGIRLDSNQGNPPSSTVSKDSSENLVLPTSKHFQIISFQTGATVFNIDYHRGVSDSPPPFVLNSDTLYVSFGNNTSRINIKSKNKKWGLSNFKILGEHGAFLIGLSSDESQYLIVDKKTGHVSYRISNPDSRHENMKFIGRFILMNDKVIYK